MRHIPSQESTASVYDQVQGEEFPTTTTTSTTSQVQGEEFPTVETFMAKYRLDAPAALERIKVKDAE